MTTPPNIDPDLFNGMVGQLYRALLLIISVTLLWVIGVLIFVVWGEPVSEWFRPAPSNEPALVAERRADAAPTQAEIVDGIHVPSGLVVAEGFETVKATCTACHSGQLVTQNRATREGWEEMIRWMQSSQGLWDLGEQEPIILDYLATYYAPEAVGRRATIDAAAIEWYWLEE